MYVYKNMCGMLSLVDILFLLVLSSGRFSQYSCANCSLSGESEHPQSDLCEIKISLSLSDDRDISSPAGTALSSSSTSSCMGIALHVSTYFARFRHCECQHRTRKSNNYY
jgi:hypothetical protein